LLGYHGNSINNPLHSNGRLPNITHVGCYYKLSAPTSVPRPAMDFVCVCVCVCVCGGGGITGNAMEGLLKPGPLKLDSPIQSGYQSTRIFPLYFTTFTWKYHKYGI
jgi:hypothetical protein